MYRFLSIVVFFFFLSSTLVKPTRGSSPLFNLFKPFGLFTTKENLAGKKFQELCAKRGGTYVNEECLEFFPERLDFVSARSTCNKKGGDLWVPPAGDLDNPFYLQKLIVNFPKLFYTIQNKFWVGIFRTGDRFSTVDGEDIGDISLMRIKDSGQGDCVTFTYEDGPLIASPENCEADSSNPTDKYEFAFVCEFPNKLTVTNLNDGLFKSFFVF
ncbi:UNVERIFIED_CONTAM: hypothetical protein RMT77_002039 [Armadillidium vulgare]